MKTAFFTTLTLVLAVGATEAYASDKSQAAPSKVRVIIHEKVAVSDAPPVIRTEDIPLRPVVNLDRVMDYQATQETPPKFINSSYKKGLDLTKFDLIEDNPVFVGAPGVDEYDTLEARRESGSYMRSLNVDPLFTVAGAGIETSF